MCGWEGHSQRTLELLEISPIILLHAMVEETVNKKLRKSSAYRDIDDSEFIPKGDIEDSEYCDHPKHTCSDDTTVASRTAVTTPAESKMATNSMTSKNRVLYTRSGGSTRGVNRDPRAAGRRRYANRKGRQLEVLVLSPRLGASALHTAGPSRAQVSVSFYISRSHVSVSHKS